MKLSKPIQAYGEEVHVINLREPTTADARAIKSLPYTISGDEGNVVLLLDVCAKYIARLADLPASAVDQIPLSEFHVMAWEVATYFLGQDSGNQASSN